MLIDGDYLLGIDHFVKSIILSWAGYILFCYLSWKYKPTINSELCLGKECILSIFADIVMLHQSVNAKKQCTCHVKK